MSSLERLAPRAPRTVDAPSAPLRGKRYGEDRLHLLVGDPHRALVLWEISPTLHARAEAMAGAARAPLRYRIRLQQSPKPGEPAATVLADLPDALRDEGWYLDLPRSGGLARAELGLDLPSGFAPLLASRWAHVPPDGPCSEIGPWPLDPASAAWLEAQEARARAGSLRTLPSSAARYLAALPSETP
jgi:hypothetical protein